MSQDLWGYGWRTAAYRPKDFDMPVDEAHRYRDFDHTDPDDGEPHLREEVGENGILNPLLIHHDGADAVIADGHHRLELARQMGHSHVPVRVQYVPALEGYKTLSGLSHTPISGTLADHLGMSHTAARIAMPYYHNTDAELNPGDELLPASEIGHASSDWHPSSLYDPSKVYFTHYQDDSELPHQGQFGKHTYEVEPHGDIERDPEWEASQEGQPDDYEWDTHDAGYYDYTAPGARVIRKIEPRKARTMTAAVTVYTKPSCPQCDMTHKLLNRLGVEHTTVDVTADPDAHAYVTGLGYTAAPVVVVNDGERHWAGFSPDRLKGLVE